MDKTFKTTLEAEEMYLPSELQYRWRMPDEQFDPLIDSGILQSVNIAGLLFIRGDEAIRYESTLRFLAKNWTGPADHERTTSGPKTDQRTTSGPKTDHERTPSGPRADHSFGAVKTELKSPRTESGLRADRKRTTSGPKTDRKRTSGPRADRKRTNGPRADSKTDSPKKSKNKKKLCTESIRCAKWVRKEIDDDPGLSIKSLISEWCEANDHDLSPSTIERKLRDNRGAW